VFLRFVPVSPEEPAAVLMTLLEHPSIGLEGLFTIVTYDQAAIDHRIDLRRSFVVGDYAEDVRAARNFGGIGCLVQNRMGGRSNVEETAAPESWSVADTVEDAVELILKTAKSSA
jgi:histidinol phosphatase-like enzyme